MTTSRTPSDRGGAEQAVREIRAYHKEGCRIGKRLPKRSGYHPGVVKELARELGWNETLVRKARQFADPDTGYSATQLTELCRLVLAHQASAGTAIVGVLVSVSWEDGRAELQRRCLESNWSKRELEAEIKRRFGSRRNGGRRRRVVAKRGPLLVQLGQLIDTWRRWYAVVTHRPEENTKSILEQHLSDLVEELGAVNTAKIQLEKAVAAKLKNYRRRARD